MNLYAEYKESGVEWIGEIPEGWEVVKVKNVVSAVKDGTHGTFKRVDNGKSLLSAKNVFESGIIVSDDESLISDTDYNDITSNGFPKKDDVLLCCVGTIGRSCLFAEEEPFAFQRSVMFLRPNHKTNPRYMLWYIQSVYFQQEMLSKANIAAQGGVYMGTVKEMVFVSPPILIQQTIADHLDQKTSAIDTLIADKQKLIELLKENRQAVISEAVTKGLDKTAKMKDSGIEWIGEIPERWVILTLGNLSEKLNNGYVGPTRDLFFDTGIRYLQSLHIKKGEINFEKSPYFVSILWANEHQSCKVLLNDILIVQTGDIGQVARVTDEFDGCHCHALLILRPSSKLIESEYLSYLLRSSYGNSQLMIRQTGALHLHLNSSNIKDIKFPFPSIVEQKHIISYLDNKTIAIDSLITDIATQIEKLKEYRQSVISEAVTGKVAI